MKLGYFIVPFLTVVLLKKVGVAKEGEKTKQRVIIALLVSASGHKEKQVFIWKSENPRCLPVTFYSQSKAWMSGEILEDILTKLNRRLTKFNRNILLLMDNAGCHPEKLDEDEELDNDGPMLPKY